MIPKQTRLFPALFLGAVFALAIPHGLAGSGRTALPEIRNDYDNILALDKSDQRELLKHGRMLNFLKMALRNLEISISNLRAAKSPKAKAMLRKSLKQRSQLKKDIKDTEDKIARFGGMGQLLRLEKYRKAKLKSLKSEYKGCENQCKRLKKLIDKGKRSK